MAYQYLTDDQLQVALNQYLKDKEKSQVPTGTRTNGNHIAKRAGPSPAIETRTPTQILIDDVATGGPKIVTYNQSTLIFGTCDLSPVFRKAMINFSFIYLILSGLLSTFSPH